jgi:splicing factor 3B subunit 2
LSVAELKQLVPRADIVEAHDVTSADPRLLVSIKAYRNTVPVPRHWCHKRKYLQGKRGVEKLPFKLPDFIADTGIAKIRDSILERDALKKSKQKARDRMKPSMGKIDIDYQVLHDAFFKFQTKCKVTGHGDLYYEGREFEVGLLQDKKPGNLSIELKNCLGMTSDLSPPPWLINMQRYGPPPSYPSLRIPGLNAPIPKRADFGYHTGGWGKPPVDEYGRPLYGDVFGTSSDLTDVDEGIDKSFRWGYFAPIEKVDDDESDEEEVNDVDGDDISKDDMSGIATPSTLDGMSSVITGIETPDVINLRKNTGQETPTTTEYKELYHVLEEKVAHTTSDQFYGSDRVYSLPSGSTTADEIDDEQQANQVRTKTDDNKDTSTSKRKRKNEENSAVKKIKDFKF